MRRLRALMQTHDTRSLRLCQTASLCSPRHKDKSRHWRRSNQSKHNQAQPNQAGHTSLQLASLHLTYLDMRVRGGEGGEVGRQRDFRLWSVWLFDVESWRNYS